MPCGVHGLRFAYSINLSPPSRRISYLHLQHLSTYPAGTRITAVSVQVCRRLNSPSSSNNSFIMVSHVDQQKYSGRSKNQLWYSLLFIIAKSCRPSAPAPKSAFLSAIKSCLLIYQAYLAVNSPANLRAIIGRTGKPRSALPP